MTQLMLTSSVLIVAVVVLRRCLRGRISACLQYALWGLVALRLLLPFSLFESPVSVMNLLPEAPAAVRYQASPAPNTLPNLTAHAPPEEQVQTPAVDFGMLATVAWLGGAALCALVFLAANLRMCKRLQRSRAQMEAMGCKVAVYTTQELPSPCLYGLWRPAIYLTPESAEESTRLLHILAHEQTHYRHKDHLWALVRVVCICLHWYNPLVWLAAMLSRQDSELACDESVLQCLGDENRIAYGKTLLAMMNAPIEPWDLLCCATTMSGGKEEMAQRLRRIAHKPKLLALSGLVAVLLGVAAVAVTFGGAVDTEPPAEIPLAEQLWNARVQYMGNAPAVGKLLGLLPVPPGLQYDHFELHTWEMSNAIEIVYTATQTYFDWYDQSTQEEQEDADNRHRRNALVLLALVDNVDGIRASVKFDTRTNGVISQRTWAEEVAGGDVRLFAESPEMVEELLEIAFAVAPDMGGDVLATQQTFSFYQLQPGQMETYRESSIQVSEPAQLNFVATWTPSGLPVEVGLVGMDDKEYVVEVVGGSAAASIPDIPAGTYTVFLRNSERNATAYKDTGKSPDVRGAVAFHFVKA